jgi:type II secretory pathway component PulF
MEPGKAPPLEYATGTRLRRRFWFEPTLAWALVVVLWVVAAIIVMPEFEVALRQMKMDVSDTTEYVLLFSRWVRESYGWVCLLPLPLGVMFLVPRVPDDGSARRHAACAVLTILGMIVLTLSAIILLWAMVSPYMGVLWSVSASGGKAG